MDAQGDHAVNCKSVYGTTHRHKNVRKMLARHLLDGDEADEVGEGEVVEQIEHCATTRFESDPEQARSSPNVYDE